MADIPQKADDYSPEDLELVKSGCLEIATRFGDMMENIVIVGGLVPALLVDLSRDDIDQNGTDPMERHVGTQDLDLGFAVAVLDDEKYSDIASRLRTADFKPGTNEDGNAVTHRWINENEPRIKVDFLMPKPDSSSEGGTPQHLEGDFSAIIAPGLELAFDNIQHLELEGKTLRGASVSRAIPVCNPGAFVLLKALACERRGKDKDKYDLYYVLRNYPGGTEDVASFYQPFLDRDHPEAQKALHYLDDYFESRDSAGPVAISAFLYGGRDDSVEADAFAFVQDFLDELE